MSSGKGVVLVVDDKLMDRDNYRTKLQGEGFGVLSASGWREALEVLRSAVRNGCQVPTVGVLDVVMPEMNGFALAAKLRAMHPTLKVIFVTATPSLGDEVTAVSEGYYDYLPKTTALSQLVARVDRAARGEAPVRPQRRPDDLGARAQQYVTEGQLELACRALEQLAVDLEFDQLFDLASVAYDKAAAISDIYAGVGAPPSQSLRDRAAHCRKVGTA